MNPLNLSPYTVRDWCGVTSISFDGVENGTVRADRVSINLEALLNDAYTKGVSDERARCQAEQDSWSQAGVFNDGHTPTAEDYAKLLAATYDFKLPIARRLVANGICSPAAFEGVEVRDLTQDGIFTEAEATDIMAKVSGDLYPADCPISAAQVEADHADAERQYRNDQAADSHERP